MIQRVASPLKVPITCAAVAARIGWAMLASESEVDRDKEHFWVLGLNTKNVIRYVDLVSLGTLDATLVHAREVFRIAVQKGVHAICVMHNHPSGDVEPSSNDRAVTSRLVNAGEVLGIRLLDHVIIGNDSKLYASHMSGWVQETDLVD